MPARCINLKESYHQCINQLRIERLCSFLTTYSATDLMGELGYAAAAGVTPLTAPFYVLRVLRLCYRALRIIGGMQVYIIPVRCYRCFKAFYRSFTLLLFYGFTEIPF